MFHPEGPTFAELARQALSSVEKGYDLLAPKFDRTPYRTPDALILPALAAATRADHPVNDALDLCCGTGAALAHLRALCQRECVGVDLSAGMLRVAEAAVSAAPGTARVRLVKADALDLPFSSRFDLITSFGAFGHIRVEDEARLAVSVARALRPGGRFVFVTAEDVSPFDPRALQARAFNAVMRVRNAVWDPPFVMYYLTFLAPRAREVLEAAGLRVRVVPGALPACVHPLVVVIAEKPVETPQSA
jgi:SAM-dependent methyltransferase